MGFKPLAEQAPETQIGDLPSLLGQRFGPTRWHVVDQNLIDEFAAATGDYAWYHVDVDRARAELPDGKTIAHGLLTLALVPALFSQAFRLGHSTRGLNYGYDKIRFVAPVQTGDRIRLSAVPVEIAPHAQGSVVRVSLSVEIERGQQTALVGDQLLFVFAAN
jgi:acyl dehydratase